MMTAMAEVQEARAVLGALGRPAGLPRRPTVDSLSQPLLGPGSLGSEQRDEAAGGSGAAAGPEQLSPLVVLASNMGVLLALLLLPAALLLPSALGLPYLLVVAHRGWAWGGARAGLSSGRSVALLQVGHRAVAWRAVLCFASHACRLVGQHQARPAG
jgi:hypothetical protein